MLTFHSLRSARLRSVPPAPPDVSHPVAWDPAAREYVPASPVEKPPNVRASQVLIGHAVGDRIRYSLCSSFGCSTYECRLTAVSFDGTNVAVEWVRSRIGNGLIGNQRITVTVGGREIGGETSSFVSSEATRSATGAATPGEEIVLTMASTFTDDSGQVTATVPAPPFDPTAVQAIGCPTLDPVDVLAGEPVEAEATVANPNAQDAVFDLTFVFVGAGGGETVVSTRAGLLLGAGGEDTFPAELDTSRLSIASDGPITGDVDARVENVREA